jgi:hypothetical protein
MTVSTENKAPDALHQDKTEVSQQAVQAPATTPQEPKKEADQVEDPNWRAFREARKQDRAQREAAENKTREKEAEVAALKAAMEAAFAKTPVQPQYAQDPQGYHEETEDERIEKKVQAALAQREVQYERERQQREAQEYPQRLAKTYGDFHQTIAQENLDYLDYHFPEVSIPLQRLPEGFDKWSDIYKAIKKFVPNGATSRKDSARADANFNKPKSMSTSGVTQPGEATTSARLTEEKRAANWERMQKILKGVS